MQIDRLLTSSPSIQTIETSFTIEGLGLLLWLCNELAAYVGDFMEYFSPDITAAYPTVVGDIDSSCVKDLSDWIG